MANWLQQVAGSAGKAINTLGNTKIGSTGVSYNNLAQAYIPKVTLSSSLQNYGGNTQGQGFAWVPQASAATNTTSNAPNGSPINSQNIWNALLAVNQPSGGGNTGNVAQSIPTDNSQQQGQGMQNIQQGQDNGNAQIESDYNQSMGMLGQAESGLQSQAGTATSQITNDAAGVQTSLGAQQATGEQGVQSSLSTAEKQGTSSMQQARDLFRQTQQQNSAQLSALGISSSSVSEALAERLGVETARRIAGVTGSIQEVRQNATNELGRIKNYYSEKKTQLDENVRINKDQIQQSLMAGLNQINSARSQAASDKSQARSNLLQQVQSQIGALAQQQQQFDQQLQAWATQKSASLQPIVSDPNYFNTLQNTQNTLNKQFAPTGFGYTPNFNKETQLSGWTTQKLPSKEDELLGNPFAQ